MWRWGMGRGGGEGVEGVSGWKHGQDCPPSPRLGYHALPFGQTQNSHLWSSQLGPTAEKTQAVIMQKFANIKSLQKGFTTPYLLHIMNMIIFDLLCCEMMNV